MRKLMMIGYVAVVATSATLSVQGDIICSGDSAAMRVNMPVPTTVNKSLKKIYASPWAGAGESVSVSVDGTCLFSTTLYDEPDGNAVDVAAARVFSRFSLYYVKRIWYYSAVFAVKGGGDWFFDIGGYGSS